MDNRGDVIATTASVSKVEKFRRLYISVFSYAVPVHASLSIILSVLACTLFPSLYLASIRCIIIFFYVTYLYTYWGWRNGLMAAAIDTPSLYTQVNNTNWFSI